MDHNDKIKEEKELKTMFDEPWNNEGQEYRPSEKRYNLDAYIEEIFQKHGKGEIFNENVRTDK